MKLQPLFALIREYVATLYPDDEPDMLSIRLKKDGSSIRLPIKPRRFKDSHKGLRENEMLVLGMLPEKNLPGISAKELLKKTGYKQRSYLYKVLKQLRIKGLIEQDDAKGYRKIK